MPSLRPRTADLARSMMLVLALVGCNSNGSTTRDVLVTRAVPAADGTWLWLGQIDVLDTPGGGDAATATYPIPGDAWIARITTDRVAQWQVAVGAIGSLETAEAILELRDSRIAVVGTAPGAGDHDAWLLLLEPRGVVSLQETLGGSGDERFVDLTELPNGDLIVVGYAPNREGTKGILVARIAATGEVRWHRVATLPGATRVRVANVLRRADDRLIVVGAVDVAEDDRGLDLWVFTLDFDGNLEWERTIGTTGDADPARAVLTADRGLVIASRVAPTNTADPLAADGDLWVLRADPGGVVVWQRRFQKTNFNERPRFVIVRGDGRITVVASADGFGSHIAGDEDIWLVELDTNGLLLSQRRIASIDVDRAVNAFERDGRTLDIVGVVDARLTSWTIRDDGTLLSGCGNVADTDAVLIDSAVQPASVAGGWEDAGLVVTASTALEGRPPPLEPLVCRGGP